MAIVIDLTQMQGGEYVNKRQGTFGTVDFIIKPLGETMFDFFKGAFGKSKEDIIHGVPENPPGFMFIPAASTKWGIDTYLILKTDARESIFEKFTERHFNEIYQKMKDMEESREIERKTYETYRRERQMLKTEQILEIIRQLSPEDKAKLKRRFSEEGFGGVGGEG